MPYPSNTYLRNLRTLSERTQQIVDETFSLVLQVLFLKYKRKCREREETLLLRKKKKRKRGFVSGPLLLKEKDVSSAIALIDFHLGREKHIHVNEKKDLFSLFGTGLCVEDAVKYYDEYLKKIEIKDVMGRRVLFDDVGKRHLYKAHTADGEHVITPENYVESRGKRLSWIRPLLETASEIYRETENAWETFLYVGTFVIKINPHAVNEEEVKNYFIIITRKEAGKPLRFVTAYYVDSRLELFKHLEKANPYTADQQEIAKLRQELNRLKNTSP